MNKVDTKIVRVITVNEDGEVIKEKTSSVDSYVKKVRQDLPNFIWLPIDSSPLLKLSHAQLKTFMAIASHMTYENEIDLSLAMRNRLSVLLGITRNSFNNNLAVLRKKGYVKNCGPGVIAVSPFLAAKGKTSNLFKKQKSYREL